LPSPLAFHFAKKRAAPLKNRNSHRFAALTVFKQAIFLVATRCLVFCKPHAASTQNEMRRHYWMHDK
jgi:hypothetical protein